MLSYKESWLQMVDILQRECVELMSMGLSYDDYWYGELDKTNMFISAFNKRIENELQEYNIKAYLQAKYNTIGIASCLSDKIKFPQKPFDLENANKQKDLNYIIENTNCAENALKKLCERKGGFINNG